MSEGMDGAREKVELLEKNKPRQQRAIKTYEAILEAAKELLVEVGLERISTNLIAERAGVTVPALYRYFPNKYSILHVLSLRLKELHHGVFFRWHKQYVEGKPPAQMLDHLYEFMLGEYEVTRDMTGGLQILRGMQAMAPLQEVRMKSHWAVSEMFGAIWAEQFGAEFTDENARRARYAVELGFLCVQLALEDERMEPEHAVREGANALRAYLEFALHKADVKLG